jgi:hypothetical protein
MDLGESIYKFLIYSTSSKPSSELNGDCETLYPNVLLNHLLHLSGSKLFWWIRIPLNGKK